jgi:MbtH protein
MDNPFEDETGHYLVLVNDEGQYSLWPAFRALPPGWAATAQSGARQACLEWIESHWSDMRPRSVIDARSGNQQQHIGS